MKKNSIHKMVKARVREDAHEAGYSDGRFRTRAVQDKRYKKPKYKNKFDEDE